MNLHFNVKSVNASPSKEIVSNEVSIECFGETAQCVTEKEVDFAVSVLIESAEKAGKEAKSILRKNTSVSPKTS